MRPLEIGIIMTSLKEMLKSFIQRHAASKWVTVTAIGITAMVYLGVKIFNKSSLKINPDGIHELQHISEIAPAIKEGVDWMIHIPEGIIVFHAK